MLRRVTNSVSTNTLEQRRQQLKQWLVPRLGTLALFEGWIMPRSAIAHPDFSPVGWHLGHIAYIESLWLLERGAGTAPLFPEYRRLFVADGLPKTERVNLPPQEKSATTWTRLEKVLRYLETSDLDQQERLWRWLIQHEVSTARLSLSCCNYNVEASGGWGGWEKIPYHPIASSPHHPFPSSPLTVR